MTHSRRRRASTQEARRPTWITRSPHGEYTVWWVPPNDPDAVELSLTPREQGEWMQTQRDHRHLQSRLDGIYTAAHQDTNPGRDRSS